jgi:hypothetical protein
VEAELAVALRQRFPPKRVEDNAVVDLSWADANRAISPFQDTHELLRVASIDAEREGQSPQSAEDDPSPSCYNSLAAVQWVDVECELGRVSANQAELKS